MSAQNKKPNFLETQEGVEAKQVLEAMTADPSYNTESSYSANAIAHPDNTMSFVDKHMEYMRNHPALSSKHYIANLRLMTRIR